MRFADRWFAFVAVILLISLVAASKETGPLRLAKRGCDFTCSPENADCSQRCDRSGVQKILLSVCYDNACYCGYQP
ncbi:uncharacterized protein BYT42DRAFT_575327 [Radiomyces spectabilis]|uniref:uncharacterized protein n=1 Tax=Radiomyces spectabilis TaxID=64574 RepID=UPI00221F8791|nr:uncharacterized protein BYT42DRAFT_575327 [Radiomyces spectabilis]KAI8374167.1 hypothetical protein BYT42DRAFT_575327 [Radiomyces spectabilis]